jgi:hypothetical protein
VTRAGLLFGTILLVAPVEARAPNPLVRAGFVAKPANTPARASMLRRLPPQRFLRHRHGRTVDYAYADPDGCDCLYLGTGRAFRRYWMHRGDAMPPAEDHRDLLWDWDAWGPVAPGFRWGPALGW